MKHIDLLAIFFSCAFIASCSSSKPPKDSSKSTEQEDVAFSEDVSAYRVRFDAFEQAPSAENEDDSSAVENTPPIYSDETDSVGIKTTQVVNDNLVVLGLKNLRKVRSKRYTTKGFRVMLFAGRRDQADEVMEQMEELYPLYEVSLTYDQPNYKVKMGNYLTKLEAHRYYTEIKEDFPYAFIVPDKIEVNLNEYSFEKLEAMDSVATTEVEESQE